MHRWLGGVVALGCHVVITRSGDVHATRPQKILHGQKIKQGSGKNALTEGARIVLEHEIEALRREGFEPVQRHEETNQIVLYQPGAFDLIEKARVWNLPDVEDKVPVLNWLGTEGVLTVRTEAPNQKELSYLVVRDSGGTFELEGKKNDKVYKRIVYRENPLKGSFPFLGKAIWDQNGWLVENFIGDTYLIPQDRLQHAERQLEDGQDFGQSQLKRAGGSSNRFVLQSKRWSYHHSQPLSAPPESLDKNTMIGRLPNGSNLLFSKKGNPTNSTLEFDGKPDDLGRIWSVRKGDDQFIIRKYDFAASRAFKEVVQDLGDLLLVRIGADAYTFVSKRAPGWDANMTVTGKPERFGDAWLFEMSSGDFFLMKQKVTDHRSPPMAARPTDVGLAYLSENPNGRSFLLQKRSFSMVSEDFSGKPKDYGDTFLLMPWPQQWKKAFPEGHEQLLLRLVAKNNVRASVEFQLILEGERKSFDFFQKQDYRVWLKVLGKEGNVFWVNTRTLATSDEPPENEEQTYRQ